MSQNRTIRAILTGFLLALFALAITPKIALHALVAHHTDQHLRADNGVDQYNTAGYHCAVENLVVELPFLHQVLAFETIVPRSFGAFCSVALQRPLSSFPLVVGLRGPPAVC